MKVDKYKDSLFSYKRNPLGATMCQFYHLKKYEGIKHRVGDVQDEYDQDYQVSRKFGKD